MTSDMRLGMAQSFRTGRSSFTSNNGYESPSLNPASVSNGEEYDNYGSNFAPPYTINPVNGCSARTSWCYTLDW
ncbi:unnamed protein product [Camellia sinensis]